MEDAFAYIKKSKGACLEHDYRYTGNDTEKCQKCEPAATISSFGEVEHANEEALARAVAKQPVTVGIRASYSEFMLYKHGIIDIANATGNVVANHAVLVYGYGTSSDGKDYWLIKNSWGTSWGRDGHGKLARGKNMLGVANEAVYPVI